MEKYQFNRYGRVVAMVVGCIAGLFIVENSFAQEQERSMYMYGKVRTAENTYQGYIRWGSEEVFWFDYFNAAKLNNNYRQNIRIERGGKNTSWFDIKDWGISSIWENKRSDVTHEFSCQFGNIKTMKMIGPTKVRIGLKNGKNLDVGGSNYNDLNTTIHVIDEEIGKVKIKWHRIISIDFGQGDKSTGETFGKSVYGKVNTYRKGSFTGYIQWDHDERVSNDLLDGDNRDGDVSIAFGKIAKIEKRGNGCNVLLNSGRDFYLTGSNDVDAGNRGVIVFVDGVGEVDIPWSSFVSAEFGVSQPKEVRFSDFKSPKGIEGSVYLHDDTKLTGKIVYDIDEVWEFETLEAEDDKISYRIPFEFIKKVEPKNYDYSLVTLKNEEKLLLGGLRDVSDSNDGLLVFSGNGEKPKYVSWEKISEIVFN